MTLKEIEERKAELLTKIAEAKSEEELKELRSEVEAINKEVPEQEEKEQVEPEQKEGEITPEEERSLIADTQELEKRNKEVSNLTKIGGNEMEEERKINEKELIEQRAKDLKEGKVVKVAFDNVEERAVTVSGGTILVPKKYKNSIDESFNAVSGIVDELNTVPLNGGESYSVPFEKGYGEGDYKAENGEYQEIDVDTDYVETGRAKVTSYIEVTEEVKKLPSANYLALISKRVTDAIKKKIGAQVIIGAGTSNTIKGIYHADAKVLPTGEGTADISLSKIDADTLNEITFSYGGDENVEAPQTLILSKADLKEFAKVKAEDGRPVYKITKRGTKGTIAYVDDGLTVPFIINSACNSLSASTTTAGTYTMIYGSLNDYELPVFSDIDVKESSDYQFKKGVIAYRADAIVGGTVSKYNGFVRVKKGATV